MSCQSADYDPVVNLGEAGVVGRGCLERGWDEAEIHAPPRTMEHVTQTLFKSSSNLLRMAMFFSVKSPRMVFTYPLHLWCGLSSTESVSRPSLKEEVTRSPEHFRGPSDGRKDSMTLDVTLSADPSTCSR